MNSKQSALGARLVLLLLLAVSLTALLRIDYGRKLVSDVFALVRLETIDGAPSTHLMEDVMDRQGRLLAILIRGEDAVEIAVEVAESLSASTAIERATPMDETALYGFGQELFAERMALLFPRFLAEAMAEYDGAADGFDEWLAERTVAQINATLESAEGLALAELLPQDPFLLISEAFSSMSGATVGDGNLVLATIAGPPTDTEIQQEVERLLTQARREHEGNGILATGAVLFAAESEARIRHEVFRLNLLMGGAVLAAAWILIGSFRAVLLLAAPVALGAVAAVAMILTIADSMHVLTFALAGIIGGAAMDYPLHILLHREDEDVGYLPSIRRIWRPLSLGCATTALVFLFLMFSDLSLVRHTGLMVGSGLIIACLSAVLVFTAFGPKFGIEIRAKKQLNRRFKSTTRTLAFTLGGFALFGTALPLLDWNDSVETLEIPLPELKAQDEQVRERGGLGDGGQMMVSTGATLAEAMENAAKIPQSIVKSGPIAWLSTPRELESAVLWQQQHGEAFAHSLAVKLEENGFDSAAFSPFYTALDEQLTRERYDAALSSLFDTAPAGIDQLAGAGPHGAWVLTGVTEIEPGAMPEGAFPLDVRMFLQSAFRQYRLEAKQYAAGGFIVASLIILAGTGLRKGLIVIAAPGVAVLATLGVLGLVGAEGNLFHVVGLLLGFGLGLDYAVFRASGRDGLSSVRVSAITTLAAFGALSTSIIPVVSSLGVTVFLVVGIALVICEAMPQPDGSLAE